MSGNFSRRRGAGVGGDSNSGGREARFSGSHGDQRGYDQDSRGGGFTGGRGVDRNREQYLRGGYDDQGQSGPDQDGRRFRESSRDTGRARDCDRGGVIAPPPPASVEARENGVIASLREGFGFVKYVIALGGTCS